MVHRTFLYIFFSLNPPNHPLRLAGEQTEDQKQVAQSLVQGCLASKRHPKFSPCISSFDIRREMCRGKMIRWLELNLLPGRLGWQTDCSVPGVPRPGRRPQPRLFPGASKQSLHQACPGPAGRSGEGGGTNDPDQCVYWIITISLTTQLIA